MPGTSRQSPVASRQSRFALYALRFTRLRVGTLPLIILALILIAYLALGAFVPKPPSKPDATWVRITETGAFRVGIDPSFPPFESDDGKGNLKGLDIALIDEMLREWSSTNAVPIHPEYIYTGYDGLYDALKAGQFDAIVSALPYDPKKTEDAAFSHSYFDGGPFIVVREGDSTSKTYRDLQGKTIGVELGSTGDSFARRWERRLNYMLREYDTSSDALTALQRGQVDAVFADIIAFNDFASSHGGVKTVGDPLVNELMVIAVRKDTYTLLGQINGVIDAMKRDGRMEMLWKQWLTSSKQ
ncbi:MAG: amino acid ABC transporter substrate-binding protein [Chloroflexi bacterium]|nr:amino acid ABC transporter substrate-binding protein [Chloroflexota bacterium]